MRLDSAPINLTGISSNWDKENRVTANQAPAELCGRFSVFCPSGDQRIKVEHNSTALLRLSNISLLALFATYGRVGCIPERESDWQSDRIRSSGRFRSRSAINL